MKRTKQREKLKMRCSKWFLLLLFFQLSCIFFRYSFRGLSCVSAAMHKFTHTAVLSLSLTLMQHSLSTSVCKTHNTNQFRMGERKINYWKTESQNPYFLSYCFVLAVLFRLGFYTKSMLSLLISRLLCVRARVSVLHCLLWWLFPFFIWFDFKFFFFLSFCSWFSCSLFNSFLLLQLQFNAYTQSDSTRNRWDKREERESEKSLLLSRCVRIKYLHDIDWSKWFSCEFFSTRSPGAVQSLILSPSLSICFFSCVFSIFMNTYKQNVHFGSTQSKQALKLLQKSAM